VSGAFHQNARRESRFSQFLRGNGLSIAAFALFALSIVGHLWSGLLADNQEARAHGEAELSLREYVCSGAFIESVFENWESEFLQMAVFVVATAFLYQRGSSESKPLDTESPVDEDPAKSRHEATAPWPVRRGGLALLLYERSLSLSLTLLFLVSFVLHGVGGVANYNEEQLRHGGEPVSLLAYLGSAQFWFESFQNWQSEFLSVGVLVLLTIFLRERGSPQSKPVAAPHGHTGES
jgi:hypothetical protein